jgi:hypothetical protein
MDYQRRVLVCYGRITNIVRFTQGYIESANLDLFICTHNAVDCRCGVYGIQLSDTIAARLNSFKQPVETKKSKWRSVQLFETSHLGGHK